MCRRGALVFHSYWLLLCSCSTPGLPLCVHCGPIWALSFIFNLCQCFCSASTALEQTCSDGWSSWKIPTGFFTKTTKTQPSAELHPLIWFSTWRAAASVEGKYAGAAKTDGEVVAVATLLLFSLLLVKVKPQDDSGPCQLPDNAIQPLSKALSLCPTPSVHTLLSSSK